MSQTQDETKTLNLEELIYYMDQDTSDEYSQPTEIPTSAKEEDQSDDDPTDDNDDSARLDNEEPEEVIIAPAQEASNTTDEDEEEEDAQEEEEESSLKSYYSILTEQNLLYPDEDFEFDGTEESLQTALHQTKNNLSRAAQAALWQALPDK